MYNGRREQEGSRQSCEVYREGGGKRKVEPRLHQPGCVLKRGDWPHCDQGLVLSHVPPSQLYDPSMLTERSRAPGLASAPEKPLQDFTSSPLSAAPGGRGNTFVLREVEHPR